MNEIESYTISEARYAKNKWVIRIPSDGSGYKTGRMWLVENVGGKWTGRDGGYQVSKTQLELFKWLADNKFSGGFLLSTKCKPKFFGPDNKEYSLKEVKTLMKGRKEKAEEFKSLL